MEFDSNLTFPLMQATTLKYFWCPSCSRQSSHLPTASNEEISQKTQGPFIHYHSCHIPIFVPTKPKARIQTPYDTISPDVPLSLQSVEKRLTKRKEREEYLRASEFKGSYTNVTLQMVIEEMSKESELKRFLQQGEEELEQEMREEESKQKMKERDQEKPERSSQPLQVSRFSIIFMLVRTID